MAEKRYISRRVTGMCGKRYCQTVYELTIEYMAVVWTAYLASAGFKNSFFTVSHSYYAFGALRLDVNLKEMKCLVRHRLKST